MNNFFLIYFLNAQRVLNNIYLININVKDNNLQVLDCRFQANVEWLYCDNNDISKLDLTYCNSLRHFEATNNHLVTLDVRNGNNDIIEDFLCDGNDELSCISVDNPGTFAPSNESLPPDASYSDSCSEQVYIPDSWFEYQLIDQGIDIDNGGVIDHKIRKSRAEDYADAALDFSGGLITNIRGIEAFSNTYTFDFSNQSNLTEVDLSYAPWITSLDFSGNKINDINLEGMVNLETLDLDDNELTEIDLSDCTSILTLDLSNNNFAAIDISGNPTLTDFKIAYNNLTDIDISSNTAFQHLSVRRNSLTSLNPYNNSNLITLDIRENDINGFALANHPNLTVLYAMLNGMESLYLNGAPNLTFLYCNENDLTTLNLSNNPLLKTLWAFENQFEEINLNIHSDLSQVKLSTNTNLQRISIRNGNNNLIYIFEATECSNLNTICVDNVATVPSSWDVDDTSVYNTCAIEIPDANFEQALIDLGIDTYDDYGSPGIPNGFIDENDPTGVTYLDINTKNISNLTGINYFTDLEALIANGNNLTGIDVSSLSHLRTLNLRGNHLDSYYMILPNPTDLRNLYIDNNQEFYGGNSLDDVIANQTLLEKLSLADNNAHSLELTNFPNLLEVNCSNNPNIDELDVSNSPLLRILKAADCSITTLDVSSISSLDEIQVQGNGMTSLILDNQPHFNSLRCFDNDLTEIDVSGAPHLGFFTCGNNQLTELDLSNNHEIGYLGVNNNSAMTFLNLNNGNNSSWGEVYATNLGSGCCIQVDNVTSIPGTWSLDTTDTTITNDCSPGDTYIPDDHFEAYLETHKSNGTVVAVGSSSSMGNGIINDNIVPTAKIEVVTSLDISGESIASISGIQDFVALEVLNMSQNDLTNVYLVYNTALTELDCSQNNITSLDLSSNSNLIYLNAYKNELEELDIRNGNNINVTFFDATVNSLLTCIQVDDADAANAGTAPYDSWSVDAISSYSEHCGLTYVPDNNFENYLETHNATGGSVSIGDPTSLGNGVANDDYVYTDRINTVTYISVNDLSISNLTGIEDFIAMEYLYCYNNNLSGLDVSSNTTLKSLSCHNNSLSVLNVSSNSDLENLYCYGNEIENLDMSNNPNLKILSCFNNQLTSLDLTLNIALTKLFCNDNLLTELDIRNGFNSIINNADFVTTGNPDLSCIFVDDVMWSESNWTNIDATAHFVATTAECDAILGISGEALKEGINLYPNPVNDLLTINVSNEVELSSITLFDSMGRKINTGIYNNTISFENLSSGIYLIKLQDSDGNSTTKKVIKK